jgi:hypothetical protein
MPQPYRPPRPVTGIALLYSSKGAYRDRLCLVTCDSFKLGSLPYTQRRTHKYFPCNLHVLNSIPEYTHFNPDDGGSMILSNHYSYSRSLILTPTLFVMSTDWATVADWIGLATCTDWTAGVPLPEGAIFFFSPLRPDLLWGPPNILSFVPSQELIGRGVKLSTHLQLVSGARICGFTPPLPHTSSWRSG